MRTALPLAGGLVLAASLSGCLGVANMAEFKDALGFGPQPLVLEPPVARLRASPTLAAVGQAVAFSAQGSLDPQGALLEFFWDFGDGGSARGSEVSHRYAAAGVYDATLTATSVAGLEGADALLVTVVENRAPTANLAVLRAGQAADRGLAGEELAFLATAHDPEGEPLAVHWDFGDGATAIAPEARHTYARGGAYAVTLRAVDPGGLAGAAEVVLPVDEVLRDRGEVALLRDTAPHELAVAGGARALRLTITLDDAMLGLNAVAGRVVDAQGETVGEALVQPPPGTLGPFAGALELTAADLAGHAPGAWSLVVERLSGVQVGYALTAEVRY